MVVKQEGGFEAASLNRDSRPPSSVFGQAQFEKSVQKCIAGRRERNDHGSRQPSLLRLSASKKDEGSKGALI